MDILWDILYNKALKLVQADTVPAQWGPSVVLASNTLHNFLLIHIAIYRSGGNIADDHFMTVLWSQYIFALIEFYWNMFPLGYIALRRRTRWEQRDTRIASPLTSLHVRCFHDDVIKWKHFPRHWPFVRGIPRQPVNSPHKGQWHGALMFSLICTRINGWVTIVRLVTWDAMSRSLWRHCNGSMIRVKLQPRSSQ